MAMAPITVRTTPRLTASVPVSPLTVLMLIPKETGVTPAVNIITAVDDTAPADVLGGATNEGRMWYELLESQSNINVFALAFDPTDPAANGPAALNALLNPVERAKLYAVSVYAVDVILAGKYTGAAQTANTIVQRLESVCADARVKAAWVGDGFAGPAYNHMQTLTQVQAWHGANGTRQSGIALANGAPVGTDQEFGSAIALATIARHAGLEGIGAHPFNLSDVILGIGAPAPEFVFDSADATAAAEVLDNTNRMSTIITNDGNRYLWGGKTTWAAGDPRHWWGNLVVQNRIEKAQRQVMEPFSGLRLSEDLLDDMLLAVQGRLDAEFGAFTQRIGVGTPVVSVPHVTVPVETAYYGFIETITVENSIFIQAP